LNKLIFVGDIASPDARTTGQLERFLFDHAAVFNNKRLICNFEGLVFDGKHIDYLDSIEPMLFNHSLVPGALNRGIPPVFCLANNHTLDFPEAFENTVNLLRSNKISFAGAGKSIDEANKPAEFLVAGKKVFLFNYTWHILLQHKKNPFKGFYVSTINELRILKDISKYHEVNPDSSIIIYLHWNFDLEKLPFPMYRKFSKALIDAGANVIVGCHSHCVQGGERYKDGYIVYGLGNFFVPWYTYLGGTIHFPEFARIEMAFDWDPQQNEALVHFYKYNNEGENHSLDLIESTYFDKSDLLKEYSPYRGMSDKEYLYFFRKNRRKNLLIPVYSDYNHVFRNKLKDIFIINRIRFARFLAKHKLRGWNN
jgi:hypothetical protein